LQPAYEKDNPMTRLAREVAAHNAGHGLPAGRGYGVGQTMVEPASMGRSVAVRQELPPPPQEEIERLNRLALEHGVPASDLGVAEPMPTQYVPNPLQVTRTLRDIRPSAPRLPDFTKVEGIDLKSGHVIVDGLTFPVPENDLRDMYMYVMEIVQEAVMAQFHMALATVMQGTGGVSDIREDVSALPEGDAPGQSGEMPPVRESAEGEVEVGEQGSPEGVQPPSA